MCGIVLHCDILHKSSSEQCNIYTHIYYNICEEVWLDRTNYCSLWCACRPLAVSTRLINHYL